ncbi:MAG TPA: hypothetical protein VHV08_02035 [Pirellulales bacterium]|jgi:hypothetical protein|nr:hypothetical protein [Pirellulales bacterium]
MPANRIHRLEPIVERQDRTPPIAPVGIPHGFVVCPPGLMIASGWQQAIYRLAYERARAQMETPRHHRMLFSVWN